MKLNSQALNAWWASRMSDEWFELTQIVNQGRAIAFANTNIDRLWREHFRDYEFYTDEDLRDDHGRRDWDYFDRKYREWHTTNQDTIRAAMRVARDQHAKMQMEAARTRWAGENAVWATGRTEQLQTLNQMTTIQIDEMQKLRQLTLAQIQVTSAEAAMVAERQAEADADVQRAMRTSLEPDPDAASIFLVPGQIR